MNIKVDYITKTDGWNNGILVPKGIMVHSTATPGVTAQQFRDRWNRPGVGASVHAFLDDKGIVQCLPWARRAGHAGGSANGTHIAFEICEPPGFRYVSGKMVDYDTAEQTPYFNAIWRNAVELCAYLCGVYGLSPEDILCHSEGHARGIASNHADVMHWFPRHGRNMDDFRAAVVAEMEVEEMTQEQFNTMMDAYLTRLGTLEPSAWSVDARAWAESSGIINGDENGEKKYKKFCTREELAQILFNAIGG